MQRVALASRFRIDGLLHTGAPHLVGIPARMRGDDSVAALLRGDEILVGGSRYAVDNGESLISFPLHAALLRLFHYLCVVGTRRPWRGDGGMGILNSPRRKSDWLIIVTSSASSSPTAAHGSVCEVAGQVLLEGPPVLRLDGPLRHDGLLGLPRKFAQPLVVRRIQVEEIRLVSRRHPKR